MCCQSEHAKAVLRARFIATQAFLKKQEYRKQPIYNLPPERLSKRTKPKVSRRKEIIKIREEINKTDQKDNRKDQ